MPEDHKAECMKRKVETVMGEYKEGKLKGPDGKVIKKRKQAVAIALSEARRYCD